DEPIGSPARDHEIVALAVGEIAVVGLERPFALVDEADFLAVGVSREAFHRGSELGDAQLHVGVLENEPGLAESLALELGRVVRAGLERPFDPEPARRRVAMIEMARPAEESLAAVLFLIGAVRNIDVGLLGIGTLPPAESALTSSS